MRISLKNLIEIFNKNSIKCVFTNECSIIKMKNVNEKRKFTKKNCLLRKKSRFCLGKVEKSEKSCP